MNSSAAARPSWYSWALALILLTGAAVRVMYFYEVRTHPDYNSPLLDAKYHDYWARAITTGEWIPSDMQSDPLIREHPYVRPPLYPYFLAAIYKVGNGSFDAPRAVQFILGLLSAYMAAWMAGRWFGWIAGLVSATILCWHWIFPYYEAQLVEPALVIPLLLIWMAVTVDGLNMFSPGRILVSGLLLGVMVLGRPNALLLAPAMVAWIFWSGWRDRINPRFAVTGVLLFGTGLTLAISPAVIRNLAVSGELVPVTAVGGLNLYLANNPLADGYSGIAPDIRNWSSFDHPRLVRELGEQAGRKLNYTEASSEWSRRAVAYMREHPGRVIELTFKKFLLLIGPKEVTVDREDEYERRDSRILSSLPGGFSWMLAAAILAVLMQADTSRRTWHQRHEFMIPLIALVVFAVSYLPFTVIGRYRVPLLPILVILASGGFEQMAEWIRGRSWRALVSWLAAGLALFLLLRPNYAGYQASEARWNLTRGLAFARQGDAKAAHGYLKHAVELAPGYAYARLNYGIALSRLERPEEALTQLVESVRIDPQPLTWQALGGLKKTQGDYEGAEQAFHEALAISPSEVTVHNDLGILFAELGEFGRAVQYFNRAVDIEPKYFDGWRNLAVALESAGRRAESLQAYEIARQLNPLDGSVAYGLARQLGLAGRYREAIEFLYESIRLKPDEAEWLGALAWIRAAHPEQSYRNGKEALALAERAVANAGEEEPTALVVLAAAHAELGEYDQALSLINRALPLAAGRGDPELEKVLREHANAYRSGRPYRDESMVAAP